MITSAARKQSRLTNALCAGRILIGPAFNYFWLHCNLSRRSVFLSLLCGMLVVAYRKPRVQLSVISTMLFIWPAVDGEAHLLTTEDSDLRLLGETYQSVRIVNWKELKATLVDRGLTVR